jgi:hypothetical protein
LAQTCAEQEQQQSKEWPGTKEPPAKGGSMLVRLPAED